MNLSLKLYFMKEKLCDKSGELGIGMILSIAIAIIIAGFVLIPGLRAFSESVMSSMTTWWDDTIKTSIFPVT